VKRPLLVVEASQRAFAQAVDDVRRTGARVVDDWRADPEVVCVGTVRDAGDAAEALLAAVAGAGLVVHAEAARDVIDRFVDDLRRLGPAEHRTGERPPLNLTADERRLLDALVEGKTLGQAAAELHLSRRTADRRLSSAKTKLGASSSAEAVVAYVRRLRTP
jgi:DNA-binding NarL/FixJ family response regulator